MTYLLAGGLIAATAAVLTLAILSRKDASALVAAADLLNGERKVSAEYKSQRDTTTAELAVVKDLLARETQLRSIAEQQRNEAQRKARDLLRKHMRTATDEEIRETVAELFTTPLAVVPRPPDGVRVEAPKRSESGPDAILPLDA